MDNKLEPKVQKKHHQTGVTLIELMLVVAILGIVSGIGGAYLNLDKTKVKNAAINLKNDLRLARSEAITRNSLIIFQVGNASYYNATTINGNQLLFENKLKKRIEISPAPQTLTFSPLGSTSGTSFDVNATNQGYKITINNAGNVKIE